MGLISRKVTKDFLARKLDNWDWLKRESKSDIKQTVREMEPRPRFGRLRLWTHQYVCFLLMVHLKRFMLFLDMGGGKTLITLMVLKYLKKTGHSPKAIVFVPYVITVDTWIEETEKWTDLKCIPLVGSAAENLDDLKNRDGDLYVMAYQSGVAMFAKKTRNEGELKKGQKRVDWQLDAATVRKHTKGFNFIAMDEIHKCKNVNSMTYRMCRAISKECTWSYGLTGTPFGKNLEDLWAQFFLIDLGETLGNTLGLFRSVFFSERQGWFGGYEYHFKQKLMPVLEKVIKHRSIRYEIDEIHDMPKRINKVKVVKASDAIAEYYNKIIEAMENLSFGKVKFKELESQYMRLRQLSSGFMTLRGDDKSKTEVQFPENPKLDAMEEIISSMPETSKAIIFHDFRFTNKIISDRLKQMKVPHARVWGGAKDSLKELRKFKKDPKCRVLVINCQAGSSSQNLQMANYVIYYEQPRSSIDRQQSERRAYRPGQKKRVFFFDLIMEGTTDESQAKSNEEGRNLLQRVLDGKTKFKRLVIGA